MELLTHALEQAEAGVVPAPDDSFKWDTLGPGLLIEFDKSFGAQRQIQTTTPRKKVASFLAHRVPRRVVALTLLFRHGMYPEAVPVVRAAYEDWLTSAYLMLRPGEENCADFWYEDQYRLLAKWYRATARLLPGQDLDRFVAPGEKEKFAKYFNATNPELKPLGGIQWAQMAQKVGLADVHDCAYTNLSGLSHGSPLNAGMMVNFKPGTNIGVADLLQRNDHREHQPALWAYWFSLRVLTLCAKEFDFDLERQSTVILDLLHVAPQDPVLSVIRREQPPCETR